MIKWRKEVDYVQRKTSVASNSECELTVNE